MQKFESVAMPESATVQIAELHKLLGLGERAALVGRNGSEQVELPDFIYRVLKDVVTNVKHGRSVVVLPGDAQLTTQMAANILGVSRPHLIKLIDSGMIPHTKTGSHRRISIEDLNSYAKLRDSQRYAIIKVLGKEALADGSYEGIPIPDDGEDE